MSIVSDEDIRFFQAHGAVCLRDFLEPHWLQLLALGFHENMERPGPYACFYTSDNSPGLFRDDYCNWQRIASFKQVIFEGPLGEAAGRLLASREIRLFHEHIFYKQAGTLKKTPWHQDLPYYCVDGDQGISFWIPLADVDETNKLEFISGSHRWNKLFRPMKFNGVDSYNVPDDLYENLPDIDSSPTAFQKLSWTMRLGDAIAFDFRTIHGNTNTDSLSASERKTVSIRFLGENMRYTSRPGEKSPPFPELNLQPGAPMVDDLFPLVWRKNL